AGLGEAIECPVLVETRHLDRPLDRLATAVKRERTISVACDRDDAPIKLWSEFAVDRKLGFAGSLALVQARKIKKGIAHRALDLERAIPGKKHDRRMRLVAGYLCCGGGGRGGPGSHHVEKRDLRS